jgi:hypothetical protein
MYAALALAYTAMMSAVTMSVDIPEFVQIVRLSDQELRARFGLPAQCAPVVSAIRTPRAKVRVVISCGAESAAASPRPGRERTPPTTR